MKYLVAVSGGVDSVVLLDMLVKTKHTLVVAHVDHGIRGEDSHADARFVEALAKSYGVPFVIERLKLRSDASEDMARRGRYTFLREQARIFGAKIATAHHSEDVIETIAINLMRGTGWRGLAVMGGAEIARPLIALTKTQIYMYALSHHLEWVEDETNRSDAYLRNRIRRTISSSLTSSQRQELIRLRAEMLQVRRDIEQEIRRVDEQKLRSRYFMTHIDTAVARELLGDAIAQQTGVRPVRAQIDSALLSIKTARSGSIHHVGERTSLQFTSRTFSINRV